MTSTSTTVAAVLAAGRSSRFPGDKLLHPLGGQPLATYVVDALLGVDLMLRLAVCPADSPGRATLFRDKGFEVVVNAAPERGLSSSLALAAQRATDLEAQALLICLADMPFVTEKHLQRLLERSGDEPSATLVNGHGHPPAVFPRRQFPQLVALSGDLGGRELLARARLVEAPPGLARDFDTLEDFG